MPANLAKEQSQASNEMTSPTSPEADYGLKHDDGFDPSKYDFYNPPRFQQYAIQPYLSLLRADGLIPISAARSGEQMIILRQPRVRMYHRFRKIILID